MESQRLNFVLRLPPKPSRVRFAVAAFVLALSLAGCVGQRPRPVLTSVGAVLQLGEDELAAARTVRLDGVITLLDPVWHLMAVQDASGGVFVDLPERAPALALGQRVEVIGATAVDNHFPSIVNAQVHVLGAATLPAPRRVSLSTLAEGQALYRRVEVELTPERSVLADLLHTAWLDARAGSRRVEVIGRTYRRFLPGMLNGRRVRVRGVALAYYTPSGALDHVRLMFEDEHDVDLLEPLSPTAPTTASTLPPLTAIADVKRLTRTQADRGLPVEIEGVATAVVPEHGGFIVQNGGLGVYVFRHPQSNAQVVPGQRVRVIGSTAMGGFAPVIAETRIETLGRTALPAPARVDNGEPFRGSLENAWVELDGVATSVTAQRGAVSLRLFSGTRRVEVWFAGCQDATALRPLLNARLRVRGALGPEFNTSGSLTGYRLLASTPADVDVLEPPSSFAEPRSIASLAGFDFRGAPRQRIRTSGTVTYRDLMGRVYLQEGANALRVLSDGVNDPPVGSTATVEGFAAPDTATPQLEEPHWIAFVPGGTVTPRAVPVETMLSGEIEGRLVTVEGFLEYRRVTAGRLELHLQTGHGEFSSFVDAASTAAELPALRHGAMLRLTGVCETLPGWRATVGRVAALRLRSLADIVVVQPAPWWDLRRALYAAFAFAALLVLALVWVARLRLNVLNEMELRSKLEEQLRHAQKLESVGRLAGGVAHDFNNYLTVILGYSSILLDQFEANSPVHQQLAAIRDVSGKAAALTRQLLAFSRRQVMQPVLCDLNTMIEETKKTLLPLIGDHITLELHLERPLSRVNMDTAQFTQVLMNLAVNARDAMPKGGKLLISTADTQLDADYAKRYEGVAPGRYVRLTVADTGTGMDEETVARIFEPFFTTKGKGHGTGLGLAVVFGIVKQSGGHIDVKTAPGAGTAFHIYLRAAASGEAGSSTAPIATALRGRETILVVEDQDEVRDLVCAGLRDYGYHVVDAPGPRAALDLLEVRAMPPDLLLTDMMMPEMSGRQLAVQVRRRWPAMPVLFMSGYSEEAAEHGGVLTPGISYLQKPFSPAEAASAVRRALGPASSSAAGGQS